MKNGETILLLFDPYHSWGKNIKSCCKSKGFILCMVANSGQLRLVRLGSMFLILFNFHHLKLQFVSLCTAC